MKLFTLPNRHSRRFFESAPLLSLLALFLTSCLGDDDKTKPTIDVTTIWATTRIGAPMNDYVGKQWESKTFSAEEMKLFASLDTTNLSGATKPLKVTGPSKFDPTVLSMAYPNPFTRYFDILFGVDSSYTGNFVFKGVIVDQSLKPVFKHAVRSYAQSGRSGIRIEPNLATGNYRLYYTLSAQSDPHFFKSWGNIKYTP